MELWVNYYLSFAVSGALLAWWRIFLPSMHLLWRETEGDHPILRSQVISGTVWVGISVLFLPVLIIPLLQEKARIRFILSLTNGFLQRG